jgi:hypothetical protein
MMSENTQIITLTTYLKHHVDLVIINAADKTVNVILPVIIADETKITLKRTDNNNNLVFIIGAKSNKIDDNCSKILKNNKEIKLISKLKTGIWKINK